MVDGRSRFIFYGLCDDYIVELVRWNLVYNSGLNTTKTGFLQSDIPLPRLKVWLIRAAIRFPKPPTGKRTLERQLALFDSKY